MTKSLPTTLWLDVLVLLDSSDLEKVIKCGILGKEWEDDSFWKQLCTKRLAMHGPEPTQLQDAYGADHSVQIEAVTTKVECNPDGISHRNWYLDAIKLVESGHCIVFPSLLRGVYQISITPHDRHRSRVKVTIIQNGISRKLWLLKSNRLSKQIVCPEYLHMIHTGPATFLCGGTATIELERKLDVPLNPKFELKSGRIDQDDGRVLVAACSCWGSWIDHRHIWCPLYSEISPFKQVMVLNSCWWTDIFCMFNGMPSGTKYQCQWKARCEKNGLYCGVKVFRYDALRPIPIMAPVGHQPDLSRDNEWDVWRDWYAAGKNAQTEGFLKLRREHGGPEPFETPLQITTFHDWDNDGILGELDVAPTEEGRVDIVMSFTAPPGIYSDDFVVDYFALTPMK